MNGIVLAQSGDPKTDPQSLQAVFRFRHKVFHDRLGWEVSSRNGLEKDHFDELKPIYMISRNGRKEVEGCWRLLPTTGPYMLKDTFPQLLRGEPAPQDADIWEISRFAVQPSHSRDRVQAQLNAITFSMIRSAWDFAQERGIRHYVFVTSVALERLFRTLGLPIRRFGDQKAQRVGKVLSVACWVAVNEQFHDVVYSVSPTRKVGVEVAA